MALPSPPHACGRLRQLLGPSCWMERNAVRGYAGDSNKGRESTSHERSTITHAMHHSGEHTFNPYQEAPIHDTQ